MPLGRSEGVLLRRTVCRRVVALVGRPVPVPVTMPPVVVGGRCSPMTGGQQVRHAAARPLHRRHRLGVEAARLPDVGHPLEVSDGSPEFRLRPQRSRLQVRRRQVAELHQVHLPETTYANVSIIDRH